MKRICTKIVSAITKEWERTILVIMLLLGVGAMFPGASKVAALLGGQDKRHSPRVNVDPVFTGQAFSFLGNPEGAEISRNHAFVITPPRNWRPPRPPRKTDPVKVIIPTVKPVPRPPKPPVPPPPPPDPPKPIRHYLIYRGFYNRQEGTTLAYISEENVQGGNKLRGRPYFLPVGGMVGKYKVKSFSADVVELEDGDGRTVEIFVGDRFQSGTTMNPTDEVMDRLRPRKKSNPHGGAPDVGLPGGGQPRDRNNPGNNRANRNNTGRNNRNNTGRNNRTNRNNREVEDQIRKRLKEEGIDVDRLKQMGIDIDKLQKGKVKPDALKDLQKRFDKR